jgi:FtsP/CotA-like multicopper oxidase with cupredoxin domain
MFQEQKGVYGPIVIAPKSGCARAFDRDSVVMLSDWSDENPDTIVSDLKFQSDCYGYRQRTLGTFFDHAQRKGLADTVADRIEWGRLRMSRTDILRCQRRRLHQSDQRPTAWKELDGVVPSG